MESQIDVQDLSVAGVEPAHPARKPASAFSTRTTEGVARHQPSLVDRFHA